MRGLRNYVKKHGKHFTEELAYMAAGSRWSAKEVEDAAQRKVYYNVTASTLGDMTYLVNVVHIDKGWPKDKCINFCLAVIGDYGVGEGCALSIFIEGIKASGIRFDFTPYI